MDHVSLEAFADAYAIAVYVSEPNARATELHLKLVEPKDVEAKSMYQLVHKPR